MSTNLQELWNKDVLSFKMFPMNLGDISNNNKCLSSGLLHSRWQSIVLLKYHLLSLYMPNVLKQRVGYFHFSGRAIYGDEKIMLKFAHDNLQSCKLRFI